jgi:hypothetical protein
MPMTDSLHPVWTRAVLMGLLVGGAACSQNPSSPSSPLPSAATASGLAAKPGGQPPTGPLQVTTSGDLPGAGGTVTGSIAGTAAGGNLLVSASGAGYTVTVNEVRIQDNAPLACTADDQATLVAQGLLHHPLIGTVSLTIDQANANVEFAVDNVASNGKTWRIWSTSSNNYPATNFAGGATTASADQPFGKLTFTEQVHGNRGIVVACRAAYSVGVLKQ